MTFLVFVLCGQYQNTTSDTDLELTRYRYKTITSSHNDSLLSIMAMDYNLGLITFTEPIAVYNSSHWKKKVIDKLVF